MSVQKLPFEIRRFLVACLCVAIWGVGGAVAWAGPDHDGQLWTPLYNRLRFSERVRGWIEVNPRFGDDVSEVDQLILRPALGYQLTPALSVWQGYGWITNYQPRFRDEHRLYQQLSYRLRVSNFRVSSRTRLEQRFIERAGSVAVRARELLRADMPFSADGMWSAVLYDELFVNLNTVGNGPESGFDQNRVFVGVHRTINDRVSFDFGYQNQIVNTRGSDVSDDMNHIILMQVFVDWGNR